MAHVLELGGFALALADRIFRAVSQNKILGVHELDEIHVENNSVIVVGVGRENFEIGRVNAEAAVFKNVDVADNFVRDVGLGAVDADGDFFLTLPDFRRNVLAGFVELVGIFGERLEEVADGEKLVAFENEIFAAGEESFGVSGLVVDEKNVAAVV